MPKWTLALLVWLARSVLAADQIKVMTFNIWVGGESGGQPLEQTAAVIRAAGADLIGMQETHGSRKDGVEPNNGRKVAEILGWNYFDQGERTGIISRFPIVTNTPRKWGVAVRMPSGGTAWLFNAHFAHAPYQPYQLLKIPYADAPFITTAAEAVEEARKARGGQVARMVEELKPVLARGEAVFVTGDFNEPSHQDWTERAAKAGKVPLAVAYPTTLAVTQAGLRDAFRAMHPDEVERAGWTWTPTTAPTDPKDRHDRIDFVFSSTAARLKNCQVVGEGKEFAEVIVAPWPSDHRGVVGTFEVGH